MSYYIIASNKDGLDEGQIYQVIQQNVLRDRGMTLGQCFPLTNENVKKTEFKIGSLDQLMELLDTFAKYEKLLDLSCGKNEDLFFELRTELSSDMELDIDLGAQGGNKTQTVAQYLENFTWNNFKFKMQDKSLAVLGANISNVQKSFDDQLKKRKDTQKTIKDKLRALQQKQGNKLTDQDLANAVYEKIQDIGKEKFIQSHNPEGNCYSELMTSVLIVINQKTMQKWQQGHLTFLSEHNKNDFVSWKKRQENQIKSQFVNIESEEEANALRAEELQRCITQYQAKMDSPSVVPFSEENLKISDNDGNILYSVVCMKDQAADYVKVLKNNGFHSQEFDCDPQAYFKRLEMKSKLEMELNTLNMKLLKECRAYFGELFQALIHLKIMRVFIDGVLRFGIPPKFFMCIMRCEKDKDSRIMSGLSNYFAEEHLKEMYGEKTDNQDVDFFPYIASKMESPKFMVVPQGK